MSRSGFPPSVRPGVMSGRRRYKGRRNEYPGIVVQIMGRWCRITHPPYGIQVIK